MKIKLFPFNKIPAGSKVVIYGMGLIGKGFVKQIHSISYCKIVGCLDQNAKDINFTFNQEILPPEAIKHIEYDYVVVASEKHKYSIQTYLENELFVLKDRIILLNDNYYVEQNITPERDWTNYYIMAERNAEKEYKTFIKPVLEKYFLLNKAYETMDFACGRGRIANLLKDNYQQLILCDISKDALNYCRERFQNQLNINYLQSLPDRIPLENGCLDFIYSWDAMVHFNYKMLDIYISEFSRLIKSGGYCFIHHSNLLNAYDNETSLSENFNENEEWRAKISMQDVARIAMRNQFEILEQINLDWGLKDLDSITVLKKI